LEYALYGSFLPIPDLSLFVLSEHASSVIPGELIVSKTGGKIVLNANRARVCVMVTNNGDRPIQVGSHYHFIETNKSLEFDRALSFGKRLDISAGSAVRFEPGETKSVTLVEIAGEKKISGGNSIATGFVLEMEARIPEVVARLLEMGYCHTPQVETFECRQYEMDRARYHS
jgi:urease